MGNSAAKDATEDADGSRSVDLSRKLSPADYIKHISGEHVEGDLLVLPWEIYYNTISIAENINASFNFISEIPEELSLHVPHLRVLNMSHNQINKLPESFHLLLHLRSLDLSYNKFREFPITITKLPKVHSVNVAHNSIIELPISIGRMQTLSRLNISHNKLRALPCQLVDCHKLEVIVTLGNDLIHPPQSICDEGPAETLNFLRERHTTTVQISPATSVFSRVRGQSTMASVHNPESASREYRQAQGTARTNRRKCPLMPPADATTLSPEKLTDMILGLLYGAVVSDAVALSTEGLTEQECHFYYSKENLMPQERIHDYLRAHFPPQDWSSNADILLLTLESLMRWGGVVDELELATQLDQWRIHGFMDLDPLPGYPLSQLMAQVLQNESYSSAPHSASETVYHRVYEERTRSISCTINPSDNSCLPSALVLGIPNFYKVDEVCQNAERICRASHADLVARASCAFIAQLTAKLLQGHNTDSKSLCHSIEELKHHSVKILGKEQDQSRFLDAFSMRDSKKLQGNDVTTTISLLIMAVKMNQEEPPDPEIINKTEHNKFKKIMCEIIMRGGEGACAHACVIGGIMGAIHGYSNLPQEWLKQLPPENIKWLNAKLNLLFDLFGLP